MLHEAMRPGPAAVPRTVPVSTVWILGRCRLRPPHRHRSVLRRGHVRAGGLEQRTDRAVSGIVLVVRGPDPHSWIGAPLSVLCGRVGVNGAQIGLECARQNGLARSSPGPKELGRGCQRVECCCWKRPWRSKSGRGDRADRSAADGPNAKRVLSPYSGRPATTTQRTGPEERARKRGDETTKSERSSLNADASQRRRSNRRESNKEATIMTERGYGVTFESKKRWLRYP